MDLAQLFLDINQKHFEGKLLPPLLHWNQRLRTSAGRFIPGTRSLWQRKPPKIEIAAYLLEESDPAFLVWDTLAHEMIHYWLWVRRRPYGHSREFLIKMRAMGVSRYNQVPRKRPYKYMYRCSNCYQQFPARRKLGTLACATCCKKFSRGYFDRRFKLVLESEL